MTRATVLYITYDGLLEPLGQSQVLAYLEQLAADRRIHVLSFEKAADWADRGARAKLADRLERAGIDWSPLRYHKAPTAPATAYDIACGVALGLWLTVTRGVRIIHARSYVPAAMALVIKRLTGARFVFDMRGFWADERVDGGLWGRHGRLYRLTKALETRFLRAADHVVTLTEASKRVLADFNGVKGRNLPLSVIPTCADLERFALKVAEARPFTFGYVGSVGTWYLIDEMLQFFMAISKRRPDARMLVVNRNDHVQIREAAARSGIDLDRLELIAARHDEVPALIGRMDAAGALIQPCFSKIASAPTKLAEYLGCGVPCLGNVGVGDMEEILEGERVGVALRGFSPAELEEAADRLLTLCADRETPARCRAAAVRLFSLESGVAEYDAVYRRLLGGNRTTPVKTSMPAPT